MFAILDTNHYRELMAESAVGVALTERLRHKECDAFLSIVSVHEITQGWLSEINRRPSGKAQVSLYREFNRAIRSFENFTLLEFDAEAAHVFHSFCGPLKRIGTMDLKIAAIAVSHDALLLTRNVQHFTQVPGLKVENWLD